MKNNESGNVEYNADSVAADKIKKEQQLINQNKANSNLFTGDGTKNY